MTLDDMLTAILAREGGYVDNPKDRGGPTNYGVTLATLKDWRGGGVVTADDVKALTEDEARAIYRIRYFQTPRFDKVPGEDLQAILLDSAVNHGPRRAVLLLQAALGVKEDGVLGPDTLAALETVGSSKLVLKVLAHRVRFYGSLISRDHSQAVFAHGWANRVAELIESAA